MSFSSFNGLSTMCFIIVVDNTHIALFQKKNLLKQPTFRLDTTSLEGWAFKLVEGEGDSPYCLFRFTPFFPPYCLVYFLQKQYKSNVYYLLIYNFKS